MIPKIKSVYTMPGYRLDVVFDDGKSVVYDVSDDIRQLPGHKDLMLIHGLFDQVQLEESRTCVFWNDWIDFPSDAIYEYGTPRKN